MSIQTNKQPEYRDALSGFVHYTELPNRYPNLFTQNTIRWLVRNRQENGLEPAIIKVGNKLFVDLTKLTEWVRQQRS